MTEKRQAMIDAIQAVINARRSGNGEMPEGEFDQEIDPNLEMPLSNDGDGIDDDSVEINDPDKVLDQLKNNKQNNQQKSGSGKSSQSDDDTDDKESNSSNDSNSDASTNKSNSSENKNSSSDDSANDSKDGADRSNKDTGEKEPSKNNDKNSDSKNASNKSQKSTGGDIGEGEDDEDGGDGEFDDSLEDDDYINAWNEIMDKYDSDNYSDKDLETLLNNILNGKIDSID